MPPPTPTHTLVSKSASVPALSSTTGAMPSSIGNNMCDDDGAPEANELSMVSSNGNAANPTKVQDVGSILNILYSSQAKQSKSKSAAMVAATADLLIANNNVPTILEDLHMTLNVHQGGYSGWEADVFYYSLGKCIWLPRLREFVRSYPFPNQEYICEQIHPHLHNISIKLSTQITFTKRLWDACGAGHIGDTCAQILMVGYKMESIDDMIFSYDIINMLTIDYEASIEGNHPALTMKHIIDVLWDGISK